MKNKQDKKTNDILLPKNIYCPFCNTFLELEEKERHLQNLFCPICKKTINYIEINNPFDKETLKKLTKRKPNYRMYILIGIFILIVLGIIKNPTNNPTSIHSNNQIQKKIGNYSIIKASQNDALGVCVLYVRLDKKYHKSSLKLIAYRIRRKWVRYDSFRIFFYLPGDSPEKDMAWATSQFRPQHIETIINGRSLEEDNTISKKVKSTKGKVLAQWDDSKLSIVFLLTKKQDSFYMLFLFKAGGSAVYKITKQKTPYGDRLNYQNSHGEYFVIEQNGDLGSYGINGKFSEAKRIRDGKSVVYRRKNKKWILTIE